MRRLPLRVNRRTDATRAEYLQLKLTQETTQAEFTKLPFRFAELSRVMLDVLVPSVLYSLRPAF